MGTAGVALVSLADPASPTVLSTRDTPGTGTAVAWAVAPDPAGTPTPAVVLATGPMSVYSKCVKTGFTRSPGSRCL